MPNRVDKVTTNARKGSVHVLEHRRIEFQQLWDNYPAGKIDHVDPKTRKDIFDNHCAINLSHCLYKSGVLLKSFNGLKCWNCTSGSSIHVVRAKELADWLMKKPFAGCPQPATHTGKDYKEYIHGKKGIIFFRNYWVRSGENGRTGDHIDLWNGIKLAGSRLGILESIARVHLGISYDGVWSDFGKADQVLFWELK